MSIFTKKPPFREAALNLPIMRVRAKGKYGGISLAADMLGCLIHFHGRSIPCTSTKECPLCKDGKTPRWTGYVPIWTPTMPRPSLLELPTAAAESLQQWIERFGSIKHKKLTATRPGGRVNSRVRIEVDSFDATGFDMPFEPNTKAALCLIWQLDGDHLDASLAKKMEEYERYAAQLVEGNGNHAT